MKIRLKNDHTMIRDADPIEEGRIGYGWSSTSLITQATIIYPISHWEPVPLDRWVAQDVSVSDDGQTIRFLRRHDAVLHALARIVDWQLPEGMRAVQQSSSCIIFQRRLEE